MMKMAVEKPVLITYELGRNLFTVVLCLIPLAFFKEIVFVGLVLMLVIFTRKAWIHYRVCRVETANKAVFITGCDSGLGFAFAKHLDSVGFTVFAGCLNKDGDGAMHLLKACKHRLHVVPLDIRKQESVDDALAYIRANLPQQGLWGVVNNAGINTVGEVEFTSVKIHEKGFAVNLYGPIRVTKAFLPLIRASKGRIVNITSVHARIDEPRQVNYEVAKHGVETVTDSLRMEMRKFGVKVALVEPGCYGFMTSIENETMVTRKLAGIEEMWNSATPEMRETYTHDYLLSWQNKPMVHGWTAKTRDIRPVTSAVEHALCSGSPKTRYLVGGIGSMVAFIDEFVMFARVYNLLPTWIVDHIAVALSTCDKF